MVKKKVVKKLDTSNNNLFEKYWNLFFKPKKFLNDVENEKEYFPIFRTYLIFYLINFLLMSFISYFILKETFSNLDFLRGIVLSIFSASVYSFGFSGLFYLGTKLFRSKGSYFNTFKPVTYALIIGMVYSIIISIILGVVPVDNSILQSIQGSQDVEYLKSAYKSFFSQPGVILLTLLTLISFIHSFVFSVIGISKFHNISKGKSTMAILISSVTLFVLLVFLFALFLY
jgi:hypothetical protein